MYRVMSLAYSPLCRHRTAELRTSRPFCDVMIRRVLMAIMDRVLTIAPIPNPPGLLSREAVIAENPPPSIVAPRYTSLESMVAHI